jgi:hypothetical protein
MERVSWSEGSEGRKRMVRIGSKSMKRSKATLLAVVTVLLMAAAPARAVDGCKVLLCLAGPWRSISACVPPVEQLFSDLSNGEPFPPCRFANAAASSPSIPGTAFSGNSSASNVWMMSLASNPDPNCPAQYVTQFTSIVKMYSCRYSAMIPVSVDGQWWSTTYWNRDGQSVTVWSPYALTVSGMQQSSQWTADLQAYQATQAAAAQASASGGF